MEEKLFSTKEIGETNQCDTSGILRRQKKYDVVPIKGKNRSWFFTAEMIRKMGYNVPGEKPSAVIKKRSFKDDKIINNITEQLWNSEEICNRNSIADSLIYNRQKRYKVVAYRNENNYKLFTRQMIIDMRLQVPGEESIYFVEDFCEEYDYDYNKVRECLNSFNCKLHTQTRKLDDGTYYVATYLFKDELEQLKISLKTIKFDFQKSKLTLEEMRKLHPLVKDDRFFKTSFFPDVVPECYKVHENTL